MYAKVFRQIFNSSIAEDPELRFTFMDLLVLADSDGVVDMTHEAIARTTNRPLDLIRQKISELEGPDPRSRTPDANGARIRRLDDHRDWGWVIINYDRFRNIATDEQRRIKTKLRVQKYRCKVRKVRNLENDSCNAPVTPSNAGVTPPYPSSYASSSDGKGSVEGKPTGCDIIHGEQKLKRIEARIKTIQGQATESALGRTYSEAQKAELNKLRDFKKKLLEALDYPV